MADRINYEVNFSAAGVQALWNEYLAGGESAGRALNQALGGKVKKELALEVKADDSGVKRLVASEREVLTELQKIINLQDKANKTQEGSVTSLRQQVNQAKQLRDGMVKYASSADNVKGKLGTINGVWTAQNERVRDLQRQLDIAAASNVWEKLAAEYNLKGLAGAGRQITDLVNIFQSVSIIVGQVIGSVNQLFDALQRVQSIKLTFQGIGAGGDIGTVFSESSRIAQGLGVNLNTVRDGFQQLSPVILATGGNVGDVSAVTEALSSRFVTFGLSADKSRRVMNGVVQAFSKGKLMAEELTQQISEADPAFRTDLANAIGVSVQELGEMVKAGKVTNAVLLEAIPRMSKAAGLFGKLGTTALDAARGFREGGVTVEQFRNKLATIEQLTLEKLVDPDVGPLKPLLAGLLELRAVVTDVAVAFANSEVFESFLRVLGAAVSQVALVIQVIVKLGTIIASITQPIFSALNTIDSLGGLLKGLGVISSAVAAIIITKLVAAIVTIGAGGIVSAATTAISGLSAAITFLATGGLANLVKTVASSIAAIVGLSTATVASTAVENAAAGATVTRQGAIALLTKWLGLQKAADALSAAAAGANATAQVRTAGGIAITGTAAAGAIAPVNGLAAATSGLTVASSGLGAALAAAIPVIGLVAAAIGAVILTIVTYKAATDNSNEMTSKFDQSLRLVKESAAAAKKGFDEGAAGIDKFTASLRALQTEAKEAEKIKFDNFVLSGGLSEIVGIVGDLGASFKDLSIGSAIDAATKFGKRVKQEMGTAAAAIGAYDAANDKSGVGAKKVAQDILVAQAAISSSLDITRAKRAQLLEEEMKNGGATAQSTIQKLAEFDKEIKKLEELEEAQAKLRRKAREKGIVIDVSLDIKDAEKIVAELGEEAKGLKARVQLETDPEKRAKLQSELNALEGQLKFLGSDITQVKIDAKFTIEKRALDDALNISQAFLDNLQSSVEYVQALYNLDAAYISGAEKSRQAELDGINDRLEKEKEIRQEKIQALQDAGVGEAALKQLKDQDREADKAGKEEIKKKEGEIKQLAEEKRQIEIQALKAKLDALPAQQQAERESLLIQQELAALELEKLQNANKRAELEGRQRATDLAREASEAEKRGDTVKAQELNDRYQNQLEYLKLLEAESVSLEKSKAAISKINDLQISTLNNKQAAQTLDLESQLAAENAAGSQERVNQAVTGTANALAAGAQNAAALAQASKDAEAYEKSGASEARKQAEAKEDALTAQDALTQSAGDAAEATGDIPTATGKAVDSTGDVKENLKDAATEADNIADSLLDLDGKKIDVQINVTGGPQGLWTGGPTVGGQTYRVNELGREGFLTASGNLDTINKPRNGLWRAPGKGMVIPAHIMSKLDIPTGRVSTGVRPAAVGAGSNGMARIVRAIQGALSQSNKADPGLQEMASVQAHQAHQIGKLSRAVNKLVDKDWNVNVGIRNNDNASYLQALNRMM